LRRARENMRQRDGEDKGYKDADVLEHSQCYSRSDLTVPRAPAW
jgi:hypothetical protein